MFQNYLQAENILLNFCNGALITMNCKINEVDKSRRIRISKRLRERRAQST